MDKIGDAQFRVMCGLLGVDAAIKAAKRMGMKASDEQIEANRKKEAEFKKQWDRAFAPKEQ